MKMDPKYCRALKITQISSIFPNQQWGVLKDVPSVLTSRERTKSLLLPTRMMGVWGWFSLRRRRSWAVRWKLRRSVTENTNTHTSHTSMDRSCWNNREAISIEISIGVQVMTNDRLCESVWVRVCGQSDLRKNIYSADKFQISFHTLTTWLNDVAWKWSIHGVLT